MIPPSRPKCDPSGFALVLTLTLLVLVTVVALGMLSLSAVALRGSSLAQDQAEARANARMAMMLAIGELQAAMGPDRRISVTGGQAGAVDTSARRHWTGVYDSWKAGEDRPAAAVFQRWLVSGDPAALARKETASSGEIGRTTSALFGGEIRVETGLVNLAKEGTALGWWIGDENTKARLNATPAAQKQLAEWTGTAQSLAAPGHQAVAAFAKVAPADPRLTGLPSLATVEILGADKAARSAAKHDFTVWSQGVLSDVRAGGLRKDLSFYLEKSDADRPTAPLYQHLGKSGANFGELWTYYNLWRKLQPASGTHPDGSPLPSNSPMLAGLPTAAEEAVNPFAPYNRPILIRAGWMISVRTDPPTAPATDYSLKLVLDPILTFWNPYDVTLRLPGGASPATSNHLSVRCWGLPYDIGIYKNGTLAGGSRKTFNSLAQAATGSVTSLEVGVAGADPLVIRPGEVLIYSQAGTAETDVTSVADRTPAKLGWGKTGGFALDTGVKVAAGDSISLDMEPSGNLGASGYGLIEFLEWVGRDAPLSGTDRRWTGGLIVDRVGNGATLKANTNTHVFPSIPLISLGSSANLSGKTGKKPVAFFSLAMRTEEDSRVPGRFLSRATRASGGQDLQSLTEEDLAGQGMEIRMKALGGLFDNAGFDVLNGHGFYGGSYQAAAGQRYLITQSIPRGPIHSIAAFQHAVAGRNGTLAYLDSEFFNRKLEPTVAQIIGNSHALPILDPSATTGTTNGGLAAADHSYLANLALWDEWFFSSIAPHESLVWQQAGAVASQRQVLADFSSGKTPLANPRIIRFSRPGMKEPVDDLFSGNSPQPDAHLKSATHLMVDGAFNVNSTSVDAWAAMFASLRGAQVPFASPKSTGTGVEWKATDQASPLPSLLLPGASVLTDAELKNTDQEAQWMGFRALTDAQISSLANAMVAEVKARGPFLSLADFVNRRPGSDKNPAKCGALQAALDQVVNVPLTSGVRGITATDLRGNLPFKEAETGARSAGMAGYVDQADVLTRLGPMITVHSDTFTVRGYGEKRDATGKLLATARCESVVQRLPEYLESTDEPRLSFDALKSGINKNFGRRFDIIAFRWLGSGEI